MRLFCLALGLATLAGCTASAPVTLPPPAAPVRVVAPPAPPPLLVETEPPDLGPIEPPAAPPRRISQRSEFQDDRVTQWTLATGLTVLYAWDEDATGYAMQVSQTGSPGGVCLIDGHAHESVLTAEGVALAVQAARDQIEALGLTIAETTVTLHGAILPEWVEAEVATTLGAVRRATPTRSADRDRPAQASAEADWAGLGALMVAAALVSERLAPADAVHLVYDAADGRAELRVESLSQDVGRLLASGDAGETRRARTHASQAAASGLGVTTALHQLSRLPGRFQPARPPSDVRALPGLIERTSPDRVNAILARLATAYRPTDE